MSKRKSILGAVLFMVMAALLLASAIPVGASDGTAASCQEVFRPLGEVINAPHFEYEPYEFVPTSDGTPGGTQYRLFDEWGGVWYDAEKSPTNDDDDLTCWAATASNMLRWTGWGYVAAPEGALTDEDEIFAHYLAHWEDQGTLIGIGLQWWLSGEVPSDYPNPPHYGGGADYWAEVDVEGGGGFWTGYDWSDYVHTTRSSDADPMETIDAYLHNGWAVGLGIYDGGHGITCWGVNYDETKTDVHQKYLGIWVSDSDDDKHTDTPPDRLHYYEVEYKSVFGGDYHWYLKGYGGGWPWYIDGVVGLAPFPNHAPVADAGGPYISREGQPILFNGSGSDLDGYPLQYRWDFNNDGTWDTDWSLIPTVLYTYDDDYIGSAVLEVSDRITSGTDKARVTVDPIVRILHAGADVTIDEGGFVDFWGTWTNPGYLEVETIVWDFGDGASTTSSTWTPTHVYCDNGVYTVILIVTYEAGGSDYASLTVTVNNVAPWANAGLDQTIDEGDVASFNGLAGDVGCDTLTYDWDFGDGGTASGTLTPTHVYDDDGMYTVTLTVTDDDGGIRTDTLTVTVGSIPPVADAGEDQTVDEGDTVYFSGTFSDPGSADTHTILWDFGDGHTASGTLIPTHVYCDNGMYTVTFTVTDDDGESDSNTLTVRVNNAGPIADVGPDQTVNEGDTVDFSGAAIDPGSCDSIVSYEWDFGDRGTASGTWTPTHAYGDNGVYTVTLTVTDDDGGVGVDTLIVTVNNVMPSITDFSMTQTNDHFILPLVHTLTFNGNFTDPGWLDSHTATLDFGDGTIVNLFVNEENVPPDATGSVLETHVYLAPRVYAVTLTITDDDGGVAVQTMEVTVVDGSGALQYLDEHIQGLENSAFRTSPKQVKQMKAALHSMILDINGMLSRQEYNGAVNALRSNIRGKADSYFGGSAKNDWIKTQDAQSLVTRSVDDLIAYLNYLIAL
jgi:PKD repeat protein